MEALTLVGALAVLGCCVGGGLLIWLLSRVGLGEKTNSEERQTDAGKKRP